MGAEVGVSGAGRLLAAVAAVAAWGCASGGSSAPPETASGRFALVRIEGLLQPLETGVRAPAAGGCRAEGSGEVELSATLHFELDVRQRAPCAADVERDLRGTYYRRGDHLGFEAQLSDGGTVRFHGTTNDTVVVVRLSGAVLHFARGGTVR